MDIIIASDIFGKTPELEEIAACLSTTEDHAVIVDPYGGNYRRFKNETEAYGYFQKTIGILGYNDIVFKAIAQTTGDSLLIGFSIGAAAIWAVSARINTRKRIKAFCFYGSQIRNFPEINPKIPMALIFPENEFHFQVEPLIATLSLKNNVTCHRAPYRHGFMNKLSVNFNEKAFSLYLGLLKDKLALTRRY